MSSKPFQLPSEKVAGTASGRPLDAQDHGLRTLLILSSLLAFASISTDLYLPAMPVMANALHADGGTLELTVSGYLVGFSVGQLFWGPLSDRFGRRVPVALGLLLFIIGSAGCALATDGTAIIAWRIVQALGACANVVLARAMVRDLYEGRRAAQKMSTLMTIMAIAPLAGPTLGGQILNLWSWRAIFWTLVLVGVATLAALPLLPETLPRERRHPSTLSMIVLRYASLLRSPRFLAYVATGGFFYAGTFAYIAGSPFAYITYHHVAPQLYGALFAAGIVGVMATSQMNARLLNRYDSDTLLTVGALFAGVAGLVLAANTWADWGGLPLLVFGCFLFASSTGFIVANSVAGALNCLPQFSGSASALAGGLQYGAGILGSALVAIYADGTPWPMGWVLAVCGMGCVVSALWVRRCPN
ncbi:multidrug effflux MFS transporter [Pseudomonas syringae pv. syringae]|uniref:multidrug effflux MFS transporter n=1 Tax=Pseudomonas syringae TaxID=317 RepID=UPI0023F83858|nr:multidrug effflux MFS transporter [Pseudomonas syringae]MDF5890339.1 multidrug effflux MFS transporter [Pseudomonas syringae pv. syringae]